MLKVKNTDAKKDSPSKVAKGAITKAAKKPQNPKAIKKAVKDGLVEATAPAPTKVGGAPVKNVPDAEALAAKKEKQKQKKLEKKQKKAAAKEVVTSTNGQEKPKQNGNQTEAAPVAAKSAEKVKNKKKNRQKSEGKEKTSGPPGSPAQTVFVGNLPTNTKRIQLVKLFNPYGPIQSIRFRTASGKVIFKHKMRKESGALNAYIILKDEESAAKALELNGHEFKGNHLRVTKTDKPETNADSKRMIFIGNLKYSVTDEKLHQIFSSCGEIEYVRTLQNPDKGGCKGVAFICFKNPDSVGLALELKGTILDERPIHVERYSANKLGAKVKRDSESEKAPQKGSKFGQKHGGAKKNVATAEDDGKKKKSEYRGVKSDVNKKKQKKKIPSEQKKLAKKIAPKATE